MNDAKTLFYRLHTDERRTPVALENVFAGPAASACWLVGGGPSLASLPIDAIRESPLPKMAINLSGARLLRPTFWTSYDLSARFHRSIYLDPGIMKFVHERRAMEFVPETTFKVCECPNLFFFERDRKRGFADFLSPHHNGIVDWADSLVQAIDILYRLGFRILYLAGCEMRVRPSGEQIERAAAAGIEHGPHESLHDFLQRCIRAGLSTEELERLEPPRQYHFEERKPLRAAANTDRHYFRVAQYLRLSRRSLSLAGVRLISVTPESRLNDCFPYAPAEVVLRQIERAVGNPKTEPVRGRYRQQDSGPPTNVGPMCDFRPHRWLPRENAAAQFAGPENALVQCRPAIFQPVDGGFVVEVEGYEQAGADRVAGGGDGTEERSRAGVS